jgi:hypothetical protein
MFTEVKRERIEKDIPERIEKDIPEYACAGTVFGV